MQTSGIVWQQDLGVSEKQAEQAVEYNPTTASQFGSILESLPIDYEQFSFVDLGSGKGRVLLMASEFPFREVVGVELSSQLHEIAANNID
ncbi:class I SAM-dependent methyltransferase [Stratiformator vulcanicus]|uniref:Histone methylation protein DOT1 n=1 Tax=Stratiformator vulcanicus TaxID=2527980 RepID=A0A517R1C3_9PLAN|nr:class I SAM-dependent methyltransferase [Stratiformator vulcanicus]QDT37699.1 Histone methylation protein DOT1 [Stratiformator vulcanicus]